MPKQKKSTPDFGKVADEVKNASEIYRKKEPERKLPFTPKSPQEPPSDTVYESARAVLTEETFRRMDILIKYFQIDENFKYFKLAFLLACELFSEFDPHSVPGRGRPPTILSAHADLAKEITAIVEEKHVSVLRACELIRKRPGQWKDKKKENLQSAYYRFLEATEKLERLEKTVASRQDQRAQLEAEAIALRRREPTLNNLFGTAPDYEK
jgi:hypothetical protein